jgi:hypothetical protein
MNHTPSSDIGALRATACAFDDQRERLPTVGDHGSSSDVVAVAGQIFELGELISDLGDEVLLRAAAQEHEDHTTSVITGCAAAVRPAGQAASALGAVAHQLSLLEWTEQLREQPDAPDTRKAALRVMDEALGTADTALREAAASLHAASETVSPPAVRLRAALSRSTTTTPPLVPPPTAAQAGANPAGRIARSR